MRRRGQVAIQVALLLTTLLGVAALTIDVWMTRIAQQELGNAAEAAAHAGAAQLDGTSAGMTAAVDVAVEVAAQNYVRGQSYSLPSTDVQLGYWDGDSLVVSSDPARVTTVQVSARRDDLTASFSKVAFGKTQLAAGDYAIAQAGGPAASSCPIPIAIADCELAPVMAGSCNMDMTLNNDRIDNGAWGRVGTTQPNASYIRDALDPNYCAAHSEVGDTITMNNGQVTSGISTLSSYIESSTDFWDTAAWGTQPARQTKSAVSVAKYGRVLRGQAMVFHDPANCVATKYNGTMSLVGFATIAVYDAVSTSGAKSIRLRVICEDGISEPGGGAYYGTVVAPNFVR